MIWINLKGRFPLIGAKIGIRLDEKCKNLSWLQGYSWDPNVYFNHQSEPFTGLFDFQQTRPKPANYEKPSFQTASNFQCSDAERVEAVLHKIESGKVISPMATTFGWPAPAILPRPSVNKAAISSTGLVRSTPVIPQQHATGNLMMPSRKQLAHSPTLALLSIAARILAFFSQTESQVLNPSSRLIFYLPAQFPRRSPCRCLMNHPPCQLYKNHVPE